MSMFVQCVISVRYINKCYYPETSADPDALYFSCHASVLLCSTSHNFNLLNFDICETAGSDCVLTAHTVSTEAEQHRNVLKCTHRI